MIKNVKKEDVFALLSEGKEVYAINRVSDKLRNLLYEIVDSVIRCIKEDEYEFFTIEKDGDGD